ncbi:ankyrin repeat-containing domain protein [Chaetomium sp. MPI-CAGE-AT-0009]|nr:ankyrin repeat-containing domain protein [Chaetomium sp. MPI-CAGE-AT-0009]
MDSVKEIDQGNERRRLQNRLAQRRFRRRNQMKTSSQWELEMQLDMSSALDGDQITDETTQGPETLPTPMHQGPSCPSPRCATSVDFPLSLPAELHQDLYDGTALLHDMIDLSALDAADIEFGSFAAVPADSESVGVGVPTGPAHFPAPPAPLPVTPTLKGIQDREEDSSSTQRTKRGAASQDTLPGPWPPSPPGTDAGTSSAPRSAPSRITSPSSGASPAPPRGVWHGPLHIAAQNSNDRMVRLLIQHGADCNEKSSDGRTPLMLAVMGGFDDVSDTLLKNGARISEVDSRHCSVLHLAVLHRRAALLRNLLELCPGDLALINAYDISGNTALHLSVDNGFEAGVQALLEAGASLRCQARKALPQLVD